MAGILVVTHNTLAQGFVSTLEMLAGNFDFVDSLGLFPGQDPDLFGIEILGKVNQLKAKGYKNVIVVVDLFGGTPSNQTTKLLLENDIEIITGVNLPILLQLVLGNNDNTTSEELMKTAIKAGKDSIFDLKEKINFRK